MLYRIPKNITHCVFPRISFGKEIPSWESQAGNTHIYIYIYIVIFMYMYVYIYIYTHYNILSIAASRVQGGR